MSHEPNIHVSIKGDPDEVAAAIKRGLNPTRKPTIKLRYESNMWPTWRAHISIPDERNSMLAYESVVCALTRNRAVAKAECAIRRHYADAAKSERIEVTP